MVMIARRVQDDGLGFIPTLSGDGFGRVRVAEHVAEHDIEIVAEEPVPESIDALLSQAFIAQHSGVVKTVQAAPTYAALPTTNGSSTPSRLQSMPEARDQPALFDYWIVARYGTEHAEIGQSYASEPVVYVAETPAEPNLALRPQAEQALREDPLLSFRLQYVEQRTVSNDELFEASVSESYTMEVVAQQSPVEQPQEPVREYSLVSSQAYVVQPTVGQNYQPTVKTNERITDFSEPQLNEYTLMSGKITQRDTTVFEPQDPRIQDSIKQIEPQYEQPRALHDSYRQAPDTVYRAPITSSTNLIEAPIVYTFSKSNDPRTSEQHPYVDQTATVRPIKAGSVVDMRLEHRLDPPVISTVVERTPAAVNDSQYAFEAPIFEIGDTTTVSELRGPQSSVVIDLENYRTQKTAPKSIESADKKNKTPGYSAIGSIADIVGGAAVAVAAVSSGIGSVISNILSFKYEATRESQKTRAPTFSRPETRTFDQLFSEVHALDAKVSGTITYIGNDQSKKGATYAFNEHERLGAPSALKTQIAYVALLLHQEGAIDLNQSVRVDKTDHLHHEGGFLENGRYTRATGFEAVDALGTSSNTYTNVLLKVIGNGDKEKGAKRATEILQNLGYSHTTIADFYNTDTNYRNNRTSAADSARFMTELAQGSQLSAEYQQRLQSTLKDEPFLQAMRKADGAEDLFKITHYDTGIGVQFATQEYSGSFYAEFDAENPLMVASSTPGNSYNGAFKAKKAAGKRGTETGKQAVRALQHFVRDLYQVQNNTYQPNMQKAA